MRQRVIEEAQEAESEHALESFVTSEIMEDMISPGDKSHLRSLLKTCKQSSEKKRTSLGKVDKLIGWSYPSKGAKPLKKAKATPKSAAALKLAKKLSDDRWWASVPGDPSMLTQFAPPRGAFVMDPGNGMILITYPHRARKSVSWTKRGTKVAALIALKTWWQHHTEATGEEPPDILMSQW